MCVCIRASVRVRVCARASVCAWCGDEPLVKSGYSGPWPGFVRERARVCVAASVASAIPNCDRLILTRNTSQSF